MTDQLEALRNLRKAAERVAELCQCKLAQFSVIPSDEEDGVDFVQVAFMLNVEAVESAEETEQRHVDTEFDDLLSSAFGDDVEIFLTDEQQAEKDAEKAKKAELDGELGDWLDEMGLTDG
jgi:hypothetical protein